MSEFISIIIPTYQAGGCLRDALNSIACQDYVDYEIIIVDGNSSDNTAEIINDFPLLPISFYSAPDKGIYDAMNKGVSYSKGKWLYFLGSDDLLYDKNVLSDIYPILKRTQATLVYGDAVVTSTRQIIGGKFDLNKLLTHNNLCHQTIFYHHSVFDIVGLYNLEYPIIADWDFNIRCFRNSTIETQYIQRNIVLFNDVTGISSTSKNDPFYNFLPAPYVRELDSVRYKNQLILQSAEFRIGSFIYKILKNIGIIKLVKIIR